MKNNKRIIQKQKEYGRGDKANRRKAGNKNNNKNNIRKNETINIIDETILFEKSKNILEKNKIYLLNLKVGAIKDNKKIYAVIFKKKENISHSHCIEATKIIQQIIKAEGYDEGDYTITVSSVGFRWKIENRFELFEDMQVKIKYRINNNEENKIITESGILKEGKEDYIIFENEDKEIKKILKNDIIKARLNC